MPFLGTIVNFFVVLMCGLLGALIKRGVSKKIGDALMSAMAVCVIYIGISGMLEAAPAVSESSILSSGLVKLLVMIISMALGTLIGELLDIDGLVSRMGDAVEKRVVKDGEKGNFSKGFVTCSLLFCVGAMTVNGAIQDAVGNPDILLAKSVIDGISCFILASTYGIGCAFSAFFVLAYQGILTVLGLFLANLLPAESIAYMSCTGSLVILLVGTNVLGCTKIKTANMTPAIFLPAVIAPIIQLIIG